MLLCLEWGRAQTVARERSWTNPVVWLLDRVRRGRAQVLARHRAVGVVAGGAILVQGRPSGRAR